GEMLSEIPEVTAILGTSELDKIVALVNQAEGRQDWVTRAPPGYLHDATTPRLRTARRPYAYVKIGEGCDMGCTFCAIPQFRGRHPSPQLDDLVAARGGRGRRGGKASWCGRAPCHTGEISPATVTSAISCWRSPARPCPGSGPCICIPLT